MTLRAIRVRRSQLHTPRCFTATWICPNRDLNFSCKTRSIFAPYQCDQIWQNFALLAKSSKSRAIFWGFISYLRETLANFGNHCASFHRCKWPNVEKLSSHLVTLILTYFQSCQILTFIDISLWISMRGCVQYIKHEILLKFWIEGLEKASFRILRFSREILSKLWPNRLSTFPWGNKTPRSGSKPVWPDAEIKSSPKCFQKLAIADFT